MPGTVLSATADTKINTRVSAPQELNLVGNTYQPTGRMHCGNWSRVAEKQSPAGVRRGPTSSAGRVKEDLPKEVTFQLDLKDEFANTHKENGLCRQQEQPASMCGQGMFWNWYGWSIEDLHQHQGLLSREVKRDCLGHTVAETGLGSRSWNCLVPSLLVLHTRTHTQV